jgi:ATP-dependent RNA helicase DeaD
LALNVKSEATPERPDADRAASFRDLSLAEITLAALDEAGYIEPTPVQAGLIPRALAGVDVMVQARTGTGKTAAFVLPILERLRPTARRSDPQALVLVPTRELAVQVRGEVEKLSVGRKVSCVALYGGKPLRGQIEKLQRGAQIIVGTPGRVLDHIRRGTLLLNELDCVVLDEADRMLDIGFRPDIERILHRCPKRRQTLLLSATVPPPIARIARQYMHEPESLDFSARDVTVKTIDQYYFTVDNQRKFDLLVRLLERETPRQAIVFCRTRRGAEQVHRRLARRMASVDCIRGDMEQQARDRVMQQFRAGSLRILVATDVVGRGIDVSNISHIINYDIPEFCDDYVHRVGRTGRMGREGVAFTFVTPEEGNELTRIEVRINRLLERDEITGFEATPAPPPAKPAEPPARQTSDKSPLPPPRGRRPTRRIRRAL